MGKRKVFIGLLNEEIKWTLGRQNDLEQSSGYESGYIHGYINGLRQAVYILEHAEEWARNNIEVTEGDS